MPLNLPNLVTLLRILLIPLIVGIYYLPDAWLGEQGKNIAATAIFVVAGIFEILDIASEIVIWAFILVFGAVCLALALAFGLGGREVAGRFLEKWLEQKKVD